MTTKRYTGRRLSQHRNAITVTTVTDGGASTAPLHHIVYHSPTGMEWGYLGSGPADLALSILADHFEERGDQVRGALRSMWGRPTLAARLHQAFKRDHVARWRTNEWMVTSDQIVIWLAEPETTAAMNMTRSAQRIYDDDRARDEDFIEDQAQDEARLAMLDEAEQ